jgi:Xaa-Pro aminopeptidase
MRHPINLIHSSTIDHAGFLRLRGKHLTSEFMIESAAKVLMDHGGICRHMIIAGGSQCANPHETGHGKLRAGETIIMDIFPQDLSTGYWGDLTRTVVKGKASTLQKKVYNAVRAAQNAGLSMLKPGVAGKTIHTAVCREMVRRGLQVSYPEDQRKGFKHSTGHGVGLCIHEGPGLHMFSGRLKKGQVVTVEPGWYDPEWGGVRIEDTVLLTSHGWKYLVPCEKRFEV